MSYNHILVLGGSGFIGSRVVAQLARGTGNITVASRRDARSRHLLVLPTVRTVVADIHDEQVLDRLVAGADAVINLVGILHGDRGPAGSAYGPVFRRAHVDLPRKIVAACGRHGVRRYLHMSALGASVAGPSMYLRSKADGEAAALADPEIATTVFRPSVVFGEGDHFLNLFAALQKRIPLMLLAAPGARFAPVYVGDVARAFAMALERPVTPQHIWELAGPHIYTLRQLVLLAGIWSGHPRPVIGLPPALAYLQAWCLEHLPGRLMSRDNLASMQVDNVAGAPDAVAWTMALTALEAVAPQYAGNSFRQQQMDIYRSKARR